MAKKPKEAEHENLERWMVSYADFMTLLFATFVVLYGIAQANAQDFSKLEESLKQAFNKGITDGGQNVMDGIGENILNQGSAPQNDSMIPPIMEYLSQKYETVSMEEIKEEIEKAIKAGELEGVEAQITDRGLVITLKNVNVFFKSGSAELTAGAQSTLASLGKMIKKKFNNHLIRIEGHTDNLATNVASRYPTNWELSSARSASVARFLISKYNITPNLFTVVGYGDTKPIADNSTPQGREKNRRIEMVILKNQVAKYEPMGTQTISPQNIPSSSRSGKLSDAAQQLLRDDKSQSSDAVIILDDYANPKNNSIKNALNNFERNKQERVEKFNSKLR